MIWYFGISVVLNVALVFCWMNALDWNETHRRETERALEAVRYWQDRFQKLAGEKPWMNNFGKKRGA